MIKMACSKGLREQEMYYVLNGILEVWRFESNPEAQYMAKEAMARILEIVKNDPSLRPNFNIVERVLVYGFSEKEMSEETGIPEAEIKVIITETIKIIKSKFGNI